MPPDAALIHWITPTAAGMRQPGLHGALHSDLATVRDAEIRTLVSLTLDPIPKCELMTHGIVGRHFPIAGMGIPTVEATLLLCEELSLPLSRGFKIAFHCTAGVGRTGMMLACHLAWRGTMACDAIAHVRQRIPRAIQTGGQEAFVHRFADALAIRRLSASPAVESRNRC